MTEPWKAADKLMTEYYASKGLDWVAFEASRIFGTAYKRRDHKWTSQHLESRAAKTLQQACFDVDDLVENHLGISLSIESLEHLDATAGAPVYGYAYPASKEIVVCERTLAYEPLYRSTVIHEAAHVLMHKKAATRCMLFVPDRCSMSLEEREANQFMHVALLPESVLLLGAAYYCQLRGIDLGLAFGSANISRGKWIWRDRLFPELINNLCVSRQMICIKLCEMGWFNQNTVRYHQSYRLQTRWSAPVPGRPLARVLESVLAGLPQAEFASSVDGI